MYPGSLRLYYIRCRDLLKKFICLNTFPLFFKNKVLKYTLSHYYALALARVQIHIILHKLEFSAEQLWYYDNSNGTLVFWDVNKSQLMTLRYLQWGYIINNWYNLNREMVYFFNFLIDFVSCYINKTIFQPNKNFWQLIHIKNYIITARIKQLETQVFLRLMNKEIFYLFHKCYV